MIQVEAGIDWQHAITLIENLPRGEARMVEFSSGRRMLVEHHADGSVRVRMTGFGDDRWVHPPSLQMLADILRSGCATRVQA